MDILLFFTVAGMILVTTGFLGLYIDTNQRISEIEKTIKSHNAELTEHKREIRVIKEREANRSDRVVIVSDLEEPKPKYGGF